MWYILIKNIAQYSLFFWLSYTELAATLIHISFFKAKDMLELPSKLPDLGVTIF